MKQLSIIIPMYNVEPYVERCLRSLEKQDIAKDDYEIICINDGSPDKSNLIVERLQYEYKNIILINQKNQGVSRARNKGLEIASGRYIVFIDPDDYVINNTFGQLITKTTQLNAQVAFLGYTYLHLDGSIHKTILYKDYQNRLYSGINAYFSTRIDGETDPDRMVAVLFEASFLKKHKLFYLADVPYLEDGEFIARILCLAERCIFIGSPFYQRTTRLGSATNSDLFHTEKALNGFLLAAVNLKQFQQNEILSDRQRYFLNQPIAKFVLLVLNSALNTPKFERYREILKKLENRGLGRLEFKGVVRPYIYYAIAYNYLPVYFYWKTIVKEIKDSLKQAIDYSGTKKKSFSDQV